MSDEIELHDSVVAVGLVAGGVVLRLCPAYVHHWEKSPTGWRGEGRSQEAEIVISKASIEGRLPDSVTEVADGWLVIGTHRYENLIPAPLEAQAGVSGRLHLANGDDIVVEGQGIAIRLVGDPTSVEQLPPEWAPDQEAV